MAHAFSQYDTAADLDRDAGALVDDARENVIDAVGSVTDAGLELYSPE